MVGKKNKRPSKLSPIKLVFRHNKTWTCGMCRIEFNSLKPAKECLRECIANLIHTKPIRPKRTGLKLEFACNLCARIYPEQATALACSQACYASLNRRQAIEEQVMGIPLKTPEPKKFSKPVMVPIKFEAVTKFTTRSAELAESLPDSDFSDTEAPTAESAPPDELEDILGNDDAAPGTNTAKPIDSAKNTAGKKKSDFKDKFRRQDANYVCNYCQASFFTKVEVENCFEEHFSNSQAA